MKSLEKQLAFALALSLALVFAAFWWVMTYTIHALTERYIVTRLEHDAETLLNNLQFRDGQWQLTANAAEAIYQRPRSGHYYLIRSRTAGRVADKASTSLGDYALYAPLSGPEQRWVYETRALDSPDVLVLRIAFERNGEPGYLYVAEDHSPIQASLRTFDGVFALFSLLGLGLLLALQRRILKRSFATLKPVKQALADIQAGHQVAIQAQVPSEIEPLVNTLNQALSQLQARLERSRQATGNLAHALKSPLNLIYQGLDDAQLQAHPALQQALQQQAQRLHDLIERELSEARTAGRGMVLKAFRFPQDLQDLIDSMQQLYQDKHLIVESEMAVSESVPFDREDLFELIGNLLDNACKWARQRVRLIVKLQANEWVLQLEDDGTGVAPEQMRAIQNRGMRLDESQPGHGLGLSIVRQIVQAYGGSLHFSRAQAFTLDRSALGGLQVTVRLPLNEREDAAQK